MSQAACNPRTPNNAIPTKDLKKGQRFFRLSDPDTIHTTQVVLNHGVATEEGDFLESSRHGNIGLMYLVGADETYDYHAGHGCKAEKNPA